MATEAAIEATDLEIDRYLQPIEVRVTSLEQLSVSEFSGE